VNPYFIVRFKNEEDLSDFVKLSSSLNIETRKWWPRAIHEMTLFSSGGVLDERQRMDVTSSSVALASTVLGLPMRRDLSNQDAERIAFVLNRFKGRFENMRISE